MKDPLLNGPQSLRYPGEVRAGIACVLALPISLGIVAGLLSEALTPSRLVLIVIGALLYVSIARGRLLGDSIHVHGGQLAPLSALVKECAALLDVAEPQVFVRDDVNVPITSVGVAEPYALVISSHWLEHLREDELRFLVNRELAHIRAGHTRYSSILSVNGRENPAISIVFGAYLRRTEFTADRVALCAGGKLEVAISAIAIASFHHLGRRIDPSVVAEQLAQLRTEPTLRAGEWLGSSPYAARRIAHLATFFATQPAQRWLATFEQVKAGLAPASALALPRPHIETGSARIFASWWRRVAAWCIDYSVILALVPSLVHVSRNGMEINFGDAAGLIPKLLAGTILSSSLFFLWLYCIVLVSVLGRTIGMMIMDLRVVRTDFARPTIWDAIGRYVLAALSLMTVVPIVLWGLRRVQPYERLSRTRLVSASAVVEPQSAPAG